MKVARNTFCLLLLLCLAAGMLTGCFAVSSEEPEERSSASPEESSKAFQPPVQAPADFPEGGWSETREALVLSLAGEMCGEESEAFAVYGEVGAYTLCYLPYGGDAAVVEDVFAGYRIVSSTVGYPSATHLYLAGDDAVYTLRAAYCAGLIEDMGELYALLPEGMRGGYDPDAEDSFSGDADWFGFVNGVYLAEPEVPGCGWSETRESLVRSLTNMAEGWFHAEGETCVDPEVHASYHVYGEVGAYTLCAIYLPTVDCDAPVTETYSGYSVFSDVTGCPSATQLYLVCDTAIYALHAAYVRGMVRDMGALYALLPAEMQAGNDPDAEDVYRVSTGDMEKPFGFVNGVYRAE